MNERGKMPFLLSISAHHLPIRCHEMAPRVFDYPSVLLRIARTHSLMFCCLFGWAQPQRDMRWLHGLLNDVEQVLTQLAQVYFIAKCCAEGLQCPGCIILATVEATIDNRLQTMAHGLEESRDGERRGNNDDGRLRGLPSE